VQVAWSRISLSNNLGEGTLVTVGIGTKSDKIDAYIEMSFHIVKHTIKIAEHQYYGIFQAILPESGTI